MPTNVILFILLIGFIAVAVFAWSRIKKGSGTGTGGKGNVKPDPLNPDKY